MGSHQLLGSARCPRHAAPWRWACVGGPGPRPRRAEPQLQSQPPGQALHKPASLRPGCQACPLRPGCQGRPRHLSVLIPAPLPPLGGGEGQEAATVTNRVSQRTSPHPRFSGATESGGEGALRERGCTLGRARPRVEAACSKQQSAEGHLFTAPPFYTQEARPSHTAQRGKCISPTLRVQPVRACLHACASCTRVSLQSRVTYPDLSARQPTAHRAFSWLLPPARRDTGPQSRAVGSPTGQHLQGGRPGAPNSPLSPGDTRGAGQAEAGSSAPPPPLHSPQGPLSWPPLPGPSRNQRCPRRVGC